MKEPCVPDVRQAQYLDLDAVACCVVRAATVSRKGKRAPVYGRSREERRAPPGETTDLT
jgi:hypothetical protein